MKVKNEIKKFYDVSNNRTLIDKYLKESFFDTIGKNRSESAHTNFLKWFFSQDEWNCQAIRCFLKLICDNADNNVFLNSEIDDVRTIDWDKCEIYFKEKDAVRTEYPCVCRVNDIRKQVYVDLVIDCKVKHIKDYYLKLIIENKIDSPEANDQTWKYYVYFSNDDSKCLQREEKNHQ